MKELSLNKLENFEGGKFWGSKCYTTSSSDGCTVTSWCDYYVFWINIGTEVQDVQYICDFY
jgi:hypothetical protein